MANRKQQPAEKASEVIERASVATLTFAPIKLGDLDHKSMAHKYCHRSQDTLAYSDAEDAFMTHLIKSLVMEGQQVPVEYFRNEQGQAILIRGYQRIAAHWHIIERGLDPERFYPEMVIDAFEVKNATPQDLVVRSVSDNQVRRNLNETEQFATAQQLIQEGASTQRAARALDMPATSFARLYRRIQNPKLQRLVNDGYLSQTDLDNLLEAAQRQNRVGELEAELVVIVNSVKAHVDQLRAEAAAQGEQFNEEKEGLVKKYIKPAQIKVWTKAIKDGKPARWTGPDQISEDGSWTCKIDTKEGLLQVSALKKSLFKISAEELGKIAFKLSRTAKQAEKWWQRKLAEEGLAQSTTEDDGENYATFLERRNAHSEAAKVRKEMRLAQGETDPAHGVVTPRAEEDLESQIDVPPQDAEPFDPMIDS